MFKADADRKGINSSACSGQEDARLRLASSKGSEA